MVEPEIEPEMVPATAASIASVAAKTTSQTPDTQGASIPPLAIAFLVGYAVDVFFAFLEGLLQTFTKDSPGSPPPPPAGAKG